jgi:hypothetical protein
MAEEKQPEKEAPVSVERVYEQPPDAMSFYCDIGQVFATPNEIVLQFYETIPGPPGPTGKITRVRTRLRSTVSLSYPHAAAIGKLLVERSKGIEK